MFISRFGECEKLRLHLEYVWCNDQAVKLLIRLSFCMSIRMTWFFPSMLWHCWLGDRKGIQPVKSWVLVCWWWWFDWSFAWLTAPVVTTTPSSLVSIKLANSGSPGKMAIKTKEIRMMWLCTYAPVKWCHCPGHTYTYSSFWLQSMKRLCSWMVAVLAWTAAGPRFDSWFSHLSAVSML